MRPRPLLLTFRAAGLGQEASQLECKDLAPRCDRIKPTDP